MRLQPLLAEAREAAEVELRRLAIADALPTELAEAPANLVVLRLDALRHERNWQQCLGRAFEGWPTRADATGHAQGYALVSEGELHAQLIGQPAIEALERRFADVLGIIEGRLWSLAAGLGGQGRPANPFSPRRVVEAFLDTFSSAECDSALRPMLLRHYERLCGSCLVRAYAWLNTELAEGGHAMDGASAGAALVSQPIAGDSHSAWPGHDALQPRSSSWRQRGQEAERDRGRRKALRDRLRRLCDPAGGHAAGRDFSDQEFVSVLSLRQGNETPPRPQTVPDPIGVHLRESLLTGAEGLGLPRELAAPSPRHDDAIDAVGALFDGLRSGAVLSADAQARLARLAWPWLRLALDDPDLFDDAEHPAMQLLAGIVECWDANPASSDDEAELHALADRLADTVANEYHGDVAVFDTALDALQSGRARLQRRAEISERRVWQAILGSERLQAARREADALLAARLDGRRLLPEVAAFLSGAWRQSLVLTWLRDGAGSERHAETVVLGEELLRIDEAAAAAHGGEVAEGLIALGPRLRACHVTGGADEAAADELLARLVAELAQPDAPRAPAEFVPQDCGDGAPLPGTDVGTGTSVGFGIAPAVGQVLLAKTGGDLAPGWLRVAWTSPVTGRHLLVNRQGARQALLSAAEFDNALTRGILLARTPDGPVEAVLRELAGEPTG